MIVIQAALSGTRFFQMRILQTRWMAGRPIFGRVSLQMRARKSDKSLAKVQSRKGSAEVVWACRHMGGLRREALVRI